jgi:hypothetical protein
MADAAGLGPVDGNIVGVQLPPPALKNLAASQFTASQRVQTGRAAEPAEGEGKLSRGPVRPRTRREMEIFPTDLLKDTEERPALPEPRSQRGSAA